MEHHAGVVGPDLTAVETVRDFRGFRDSGSQLEIIFACDRKDAHVVRESLLDRRTCHKQLQA